jgi:hypothetical protein
MVRRWRLIGYFPILYHTPVRSLWFDGPEVALDWLFPYPVSHPSEVTVV